jgi:hypothetical protein
MFPFTNSKSDSCFLKINILKNNDRKSPARHVDGNGYKLEMVGKRCGFKPRFLDCLGFSDLRRKHSAMALTDEFAHGLF